ncbi:hypothetical protein OG520_35590 [Streptomyces sp. NBC_00984]|nr:hypothetical protein OG520_35590 [Streptomyces sp. NBC_00984]
MVRSQMPRFMARVDRISPMVAIDVVAVSPWSTEVLRKSPVNRARAASTT